jgi:thiol-disulfide isomerase/thioredoxin
MLTSISFVASLSTSLAAFLIAAPQQAATPTRPSPAAAAQASAQATTTLGVGDAAPKLQFDEWIKGDKIDGIEKGKVHVIEFWATWCGPCIAVMPHLSELQKKHPEVVIVSVAASERGAEESAKIAKVKKFVEDKGDTMGYRVVYAGDREKMSKPWMQAAGQTGIPCSFIVDKDSKIAWIGHPASMDKPLAAVLAGTWSVEEAKRIADEERAAARASREAMMLLRKAAETGDYAPAVTALEALVAKNPSPDMKLRLFTVLAGPANTEGSDAAAKAWKLGEELYAAHANDPAIMNALAWTIVDPTGGVKNPNLNLALKAAEAAAKAADATKGPSLDTLARVYFLQGNIERAIEVQTQAVELTPEGPMKASMKETLDEYTAKRTKA